MASPYGGAMHAMDQQMFFQLQQQMFQTQQMLLAQKEENKRLEAALLQLAQNKSTAPVPHSVLDAWLMRMTGFVATGAHSRAVQLEDATDAVRAHYHFAASDGYKLIEPVMVL